MEVEKVIDDENGIIYLKRDKAQNSSNDFKNEFISYYGDGAIKYKDRVTDGCELFILQEEYASVDDANAIADFVKKISEEGDISLFEAFKKSKNYFNLNDNLSLEEIKGYFGEFLLIYKLGLKNVDISNNYHGNKYDLNDFNFNNFTVEVKSTVKKEPTYKTSFDQIESMNTLKYLVGINLQVGKYGDYAEDDNAITLGELITKLKNDLPFKISNINLINDFENILSMSEKSELLINTKFVLNIRDDAFKVFSSEYLPEMKSKIPERISQVHYVINLEGIDTVNFEDFVEDIKSSLN